MTPKSLVVPACLLLAAGCGDFRMEKEALTARAVGPAPSAPSGMGPDCASCHAYPLTDTNHTFHLFKTTPDQTINGAITCLDCHSTAIVKNPVSVPDTLYLDSNGNEWSSLDFPIEPGKVTLADTIRTQFTLGPVRTHAQEHPIPAPARPGKVPVLTEYMTSLAHMNGKVDVVFPARVTDTSDFPGQEAVFNREKETCSAVACHPKGESPHWRFAAPLKGLRELEGRAGDVP